MISALVVRRFNVKSNGTAQLVELVGLVDVPAIPPHGTCIVFEDGSGEAGVAVVRMRAWPSPRPPGLYPAAVEIRTGTEPESRMQRALDEGWKPLEPAAVVA